MNSRVIKLLNVYLKKYNCSSPEELLIFASRNPGQITRKAINFAYAKIQSDNAKKFGTDVNPKVQSSVKKIAKNSFYKVKKVSEDNRLYGSNYKDKDINWKKLESFREKNWYSNSSLGNKEAENLMKIAKKRK